MLPALGVAVAGVIIVVAFGLSKTPGSNVPEATTLATRGPLTISIVESGEIQAIRSENITNRVEGRSTIVHVVPEGTVVKEGDLLVELDSADLADRLTSQEITFQNAKASFRRATESLEIQKNLNESNVKAAELKVEFAAMDLAKYIEGEWPQEKRDAEITIILAEAKLAIAQDKFNWTEKLHEKGYVTENELKTDELSKNEAELAIEQKKARRSLLEKYEHPRQLKKLNSDQEEAGRELERIKRRAASELAQAQADFAAKKASFDLQKGRRDKMTEQLTKTKIYAPQDGLVVYASSTDWRGRTTGEPIEEGAAVRHRQSLIVLPDLSSMKVNVKLHESVIRQVKRGMPAIITIDASPDDPIDGVINKVAILPDAPSWGRPPDVKVYSAEVHLSRVPKGLKPGMSAKVEILIARLDDAVQVPVSAIFVIRGRQVCYVTRGGGIETRPIKVGLSDGRVVEIISGLEADERVFLYRPDGAPDLEVDEDESETAGPWKGREVPKASPEERDPKSAGRRKPREDLTPEQAEAMKKFQDASPEERKKMVEEFRKRRGGNRTSSGGGNSTSSGGGHGSGGPPPHP
ncbi:MAG: HlyD family efflux transporter periplasmic adaptor subunit [Planctomycetia bacterium]|nr:HlyD family efflux transporter periplasmic adaptor subunit [Planctomycetia bacterium]